MIAVHVRRRIDTTTLEYDRWLELEELDQELMLEEATPGKILELEVRPCG